MFHNNVYYFVLFVLKPKMDGGTRERRRSFALAGWDKAKASLDVGKYFCRMKVGKDQNLTVTAYIEVDLVERCWLRSDKGDWEINIYLYEEERRKAKDQQQACNLCSQDIVFSAFWKVINFTMWQQRCLALFFFFIVVVVVGPEYSSFFLYPYSSKSKSSRYWAFGIEVNAWLCFYLWSAMAWWRCAKVSVTSPNDCNQRCRGKCVVSDPNWNCWVLKRRIYDQDSGIYFIKSSWVFFISIGLGHCRLSKIVSLFRRWIGKRFCVVCFVLEQTDKDDDHWNLDLL